MSFNNAPAYGKSYAYSGIFPSMQPLEYLEYPVLIFRGNANAVVLY